MIKNILDLDSCRAEVFFYKSESYFDGELPKYFNFTKMLWTIRNNYITAKQGAIGISKAKYCDSVNHEIYTNKDGRYAWRKLQIINPVLYVDLISCITTEKNWNDITTRIKKLRDSCNERILCVSIPITETRKKQTLKSSQILEWWEGMEQGSIKYATEYLYAFTADIADCYPSIYTHTISWALHNKCIAKRHINDKDYIGNVIDNKLQNMQHNQTNGIPQGATIMALIAEILLAYADRKLFFSLKKYPKLEYRILRYRDDYKIFVNTKSDGEIVIKELTDVLLHLNLKLNSSKTQYYDDIVLASIKNDKYNAIQREELFTSGNTQRNLLRIHSFLINFPNSKQMAKWLSHVNNEILKKIQHEPALLHNDECEVLIGICTQIAYKNPSLYTHCCQLLSSLLSILPEEKAKTIIKTIFKKFSLCPHSSIMNIFLQRISLPYGINDNFGEKICSVVVSKMNNSKEKVTLWDFKWITAPVKFRNMLFEQSFLNLSCIKNLEKTIHGNEVDIFYTAPY